jgi:hypothetical protein
MTTTKCLPHIVTDSDLPHRVKLRCQEIVSVNYRLFDQGLSPIVTLKDKWSDTSVYDPYLDPTARFPRDPVLEYGRLFLDSPFCQPELGEYTYDITPGPGPINPHLDPLVYDSLLMKVLNQSLPTRWHLDLEQVNEILIAIANDEDLRIKVLGAIEHHTTNLM